MISRNVRWQYVWCSNGEIFFIATLVFVALSVADLEQNIRKSVSTMKLSEIGGVGGIWHLDNHTSPWDDQKLAGQHILKLFSWCNTTLCKTYKLNPHANTKWEIPPQATKFTLLNQAKEKPLTQGSTLGPKQSAIRHHSVSMSPHCKKKINNINSTYDLELEVLINSYTMTN